MRLGLLLCVVGCGRIGFEPIGDGDGGGSTSDVQRDANVVFVTSDAVSPLLGDIAPYDNECRQRAVDGHLTGTFVAWMSNSGEGTAESRISGARGFVRMDGLGIADQPTEMAVKMHRPIAFDENGAVVPANTRVMTGSDRNGAAVGNCNGFVFSAGTIETGEADGTSDEFGANQSSPCATSYHLYCFEIDRAMPVTEPTPTGRRVFVTTNQVLSAGLTGADGRCAAAATSAGLTGTFDALLASTGTTAASRFSAGGANWVRGDGVAIAATAADFLAGNWIAPISVHADGVTYESGPALVGAADLVTPGTGASTCSSWTVTDTTLPTVGTTASIPPRAFADAALTTTCGDGGRIYCVEQ